MTPRRPRAAVPAAATGIGLGLLAALALGLTLVTSARAATFCDRGGEVPATEQDRQLQVVAVARRVLVASGVEAALVSRSGTDLSRFQLQYSHSGLALKDSRNGPWSVRQLYYSCDESRARLYDQGLAGFLLSAGKTAPIRLAIVTLPGEAGSRLAARALDNRLALALLSPRYSASAYAFATRYQNCNQWVAELMGFAWQPREDDASTPDRAQAQRALRALGYDPTPVVVPSHAVMFAAQFVPLIHSDDHPLDDLYAMRLKVSTPAALEAFVHERVPQAQRIELCATGGEIVVRRGWEPLPPDCRAAPGDEILPLAS
nr:DUF2145 domain-containing protein [uncultured Roseateles sp.]